MARPPPPCRPGQAEALHRRLDALRREATEPARLRAEVRAEVEADWEAEAPVGRDDLSVWDAEVIGRELEALLAGCSPETPLLGVDCAYGRCIGVISGSYDYSHGCEGWERWAETYGAGVSTHVGVEATCPDGREVQVTLFGPWDPESDLPRRPPGTDEAMALRWGCQ